MKRYRCKRCSCEITLISGIYPSPEEEETGIYDKALKGAVFHCPKCGDLSYDEVEEIDI